MRATPPGGTSAPATSPQRRRPSQTNTAVKTKHFNLKSSIFFNHVYKCSKNELRVLSFSQNAHIFLFLFVCLSLFICIYSSGPLKHATLTQRFNKERSKVARHKRTFNTVRSPSVPRDTEVTLPPPVLLLGHSPHRAPPPRLAAGRGPIRGALQLASKYMLFFL